MSEVQRMLVVSTAHIAPETNKKLLTALEDGYGYLPLSHNAVSCGWMIWVPWEDPEIFADLKAWLQTEKFEGLDACLKRAAQKKCEWLKLSAGAVESPELPTYNWN